MDEEIKKFRTAFENMDDALNRISECFSELLSEARDKCEKYNHTQKYGCEFCERIKSGKTIECSSRHFGFVHANIVATYCPKCGRKLIEEAE